MKVFITRELPAGSVLREKLESSGFQVTGYSFLSFRQVLFSAVPDSEWLFFYSKNAVSFFKSGLETAGLNWPAARIAALGPGTGQFLSGIGRPPDFTGAGLPEIVALDFVSLARNKRVLFPRAQYSKRSIQKLLHKEIVSIDLVVYTNEITAPATFPEADIYVFTSSMNAEAFCEDAGPVALHAKAVAIGPATAQTLAECGWKNFVVSKSPDEPALLDCIFSLIR